MADLFARRGPVVAAVVAVCAALGAGAGYLLSDGNPDPVAGTGEVAVSTTSSSTTTSTPSTTTTSRAEPTTVPSTLVPPLPSAPAAPLANQDPATVARNFLDAYLSWRFDDLPSPAAAARARARPWDTARFDARLGQASGAGASTAERIAAREVNTVRIASLDEINPSSPTTRTYLSLVVVTVTRQDQEPERRTHYLQLSLVREADGWYVDDVEI